MKKRLILPKFKNEDEERNFWDKLDLTEYYEPSDFVPVSFPNLKPTTRPISIRLPAHMIDNLKEKANYIGVPYQSLIKQYIHTGMLRDVTEKKYYAKPQVIRKKKKIKQT